MNKYTISAIAMVAGLAFSIDATALGLSKTEYKSGKDRIAAAYTAAKAACGSLSGNSKDICIVEAKGNEKTASAELEAAYSPGREAQYHARVVKAEAAYEVAKERCDDAAGNAKDVCVKEAKSAETAAKADAKAQMKISDANSTAAEKSAAARNEANSQTTGARKDAAADKLGARYSVAKEKCDAYAGAAKDVCLDRAKAQFGKS